DLVLYSMLASTTCQTSHHFQGSPVLLRSQNHAGLHAQPIVFLSSNLSFTTFLLVYPPHTLCMARKRYIPRSPCRPLRPLARRLRSLLFCKLPNVMHADT